MSAIPTTPGATAGASAHCCGWSVRFRRARRAISMPAGERDQGRASDHRLARAAEHTEDEDEAENQAADD